MMQPTAGLVEIEPSMAWNPSVVSGIGVVEDVDKLYNDMHSYLASAGRHNLCYPIISCLDPLRFHQTEHQADHA